MRRRLWNSAGIRFFELDYKKVMRELEEYAKKAVAKGARAVILIGSLAKGDYTAFSDADVIIIVKRTPKQPAERIIDFLDPSLSIDLEPRIYTTDEFQDTNKVQLDMLFNLASHGNITVVGDLNQSIYRFRGAYKENMSEFRKHFDIELRDIFNLDMSYFVYQYKDRMPSKKLCDLLGGPIKKRDSAVTQRVKDIAGALQVITEEAITKIGRKIGKDSWYATIQSKGSMQIESYGDDHIRVSGDIPLSMLRPEAVSYTHLTLPTN